MATAWSSSYGLTDKTKFRFNANTSVDVMDDGTLKMRELSSTVNGALGVILEPMDATESDSFETYVLSNLITEFAIAHNNHTYTGYIDPKSLRNSIKGGDVYNWKFTLFCVAT